MGYEDATSRRNGRRARVARATSSDNGLASRQRGALAACLAGHHGCATPELVIVAGGQSAVAVPLPCGAARPLDVVPEGTLAGVDARRALADGSPNTRLWRGAAGQRLGRLWPIESGWLAIGVWYRFDGGPHAVIAHLDEAGEATLVACDRGDNALLGRPVYSGGAFYAVARAGHRQRIVEVRLPGG